MGHSLVSLVVRPTPERIAPTKSFERNNATRNTLDGKHGRLVDFKVKAGLLAQTTIPTSSVEAVVAGLGCLCALSSVFTTKTSGVQHQIQDALVVFVDHFNLATSLFSVLSFISKVADEALSKVRIHL